MTSNFTIYRDATKRLRSGWSRGQWKRPTGEVCLVQSVLDATQTVGTDALPDEVIDELTQTLMRHREFRLYLVAFRFIKENRAGLYRFVTQYTTQSIRPEQAAMIAWNDAPWRLKHQVVRVMKATAYNAELAWQRARVIELEAEVATLKAQKAKLEDRVIELEVRNRSLAEMVINKFRMNSTTRELQEISNHLDRVAAEYSELTSTTR